MSTPDWKQAILAIHRRLKAKRLEQSQQPRALLESPSEQTFDKSISVPLELPHPKKSVA